MLDLPYDYASCVRSSEKVQWRLDEVMPEGTQLDFSRPFLPEKLAPTAHLTFLDEDERRKLNQISAKAYLNLFAFVEEYILATMTQHALTSRAKRASRAASSTRTSCRCTTPASTSAARRTSRCATSRASHCRS